MEHVDPLVGGAPFGVFEVIQQQQAQAFAFVRAGLQPLAMQLLLTGRPISAQQAFQWGLVTELLPRDRLLDRAVELAEQIAGNGPVAVQAVRRAAIQGSGLPLRSAYDLEDAAKRQVMSTQDAREGPLAFMEKRPPKFIGR